MSWFCTSVKLGICKKSGWTLNGRLPTVRAPTDRTPNLWKPPIVLQLLSGRHGPVWGLLSGVCMPGLCGRFVEWPYVHARASLRQSPTWQRISLGICFEGTKELRSSEARAVQTLKRSQNPAPRNYRGTVPQIPSNRDHDVGAGGLDVIVGCVSIILVNFFSGSCFITTKPKTYMLVSQESLQSSFWVSDRVHNFGQTAPRPEEKPGLNLQSILGGLGLVLLPSQWENLKLVWLPYLVLIIV